MSAVLNTMTITIRDREQSLRHRLRERLAQVAGLRCDEHGASVEAVTIDGRENGWFEAQWTTCCEALEQKAAAIVKRRC